MSDLQEISREFYDQHCSNKTWPLPRLAPKDSADANEPTKFDVVISGAGPAGIFLRLLLARYGVPADSVICLDPKPGATDLGRADGYNARTMEVLATLGLEHDIVRHGRSITETAAYLRTPDELKMISRTPFFSAPTRFAQVYAHHQGRYERILLQDLANYTKIPVQYSSSVVEVAIDESDPEYCVRLKVQVGDELREIRAKYVVGADGAHSAVRRCMDIDMVGDAVDQIWGVIDFVPDSNFPDIHRLTRFMRDEFLMLGMTIPREKLSDGNFLMRFYGAMESEDDKKGAVSDEDVRESVRRKKAEVKQEHILEKLSELVHPYYVRPKAGTKPVWWTSYGVGQRLAEKFYVDDSAGHPRVFLVGDACHTHTPRQGQGLNISTQDSYYLSWRLAYALLGLTKEKAKLLHSYAEERRPWAQRVVFADKRWNSGEIPWQVAAEEMKAQTTGCGIEEAPGLLVSERNDAVDWQDRDLLEGALRTGRRLFNVPVTRWADSTPLDIHDEFPSDGRYRILLLASKDFPHNRSRKAVESVCSLTRRFKGLVEPVFVQPHSDYQFGWEDMPVELKEQAEMLLHHSDEKVYQTYGVSQEDGAIALVRPDGIVCITTKLEDVNAVEEMLQCVLVEIEPLANGFKSNGDAHHI